MKRYCIIFVTLLYLFFFLLPMCFATADKGEDVITEIITDDRGCPEVTTIDSQGIDFPGNMNEYTLIEGYIYQNLPQRMRLRASRMSGLSLQEPNRTLYTLLQGKIRKVASGEETSTEFIYSYADVFQNTFTIEELGIGSILEEDKITEEAKAAALEATNIKRSEIVPGRVIQCLLNDYPYELYWYNKDESKGTLITYKANSFSATSSSITVNGTITVRMSVSKDYASFIMTDDGVLYMEYEVDEQYGSSVREAAENAARVLAQYRGLDDYEKLCGYRDAICAMTDYNHEAETDNEYGDPWQIVWVFDGKPNTKVVCEGYAKAFQYLAQQGTENATVISVQGQTSGPHMWNIVTLNDRNYLADLTAYDAGADLFLRGYTDGNVKDGYYVGNRRYIYSEGMEWNNTELTLEDFDYSEWREATEQAPEILLSSTSTYQGFQIAVKVVNGRIPLQQILLRKGEEEENLSLGENNTVLFSTKEDTTVAFAGIIDGVTTPFGDAVSITIQNTPETVFILPAGSRIERGAFTGIQARLIKIHGNDIQPGAFDPETILAVDEIGDWFGKGYSFVVSINE